MDRVKSGLEPLSIAVDKISEALIQPVFVPYIGRKSCPLSLPPCPFIFDASKIQDALATYDAFRANMPGHRDSGGEIAADVSFVTAGLITPDEIERSDTRRDLPLSRSVWRHDLRREIILRPAAN
jgi:CRISPR system Cascade subunit CasD